MQSAVKSIGSTGRTRRTLTTLYLPDAPRALEDGSQPASMPGLAFPLQGAARVPLHWLWCCRIGGLRGSGYGWECLDRLLGVMIMPIRRTAHKDRSLAVEPQAKRMFVMRAFTPKGQTAVLPDTVTAGEAPTRSGAMWEDRTLRL